MRRSFLKTVCGLGMMLSALAAQPSLSLARPVTEGELSMLRATVDSFNAAMREARYDIVADTIPPKVMEHLARKGAADVSKLRQIMIEEMAKAMASAKINALSLDFSAAVFDEASDGEPYVLIPTTTDVESNGKRMVVKNYTLALLDGGKWYFIRVQYIAQIALLREVYPRFAGVEFPAGSTEAK